MKTRQILLAHCVACLTLLTSNAQAEKTLSAAGESSMVVSLVVISPLLLADLSGALVVKSVDASGKGIKVVLQGVANGAQASFEFSGKMSQDFSLATGQSVKLVALSSGHLLVASGKVLAFLPNEIGKSLLYHDTVAARSSNQH